MTLPFAIDIDNSATNGHELASSPELLAKLVPKGMSLSSIGGGGSQDELKPAAR